MGSALAIVGPRLNGLKIPSAALVSPTVSPARHRQFEQSGDIAELAIYLQRHRFQATKVVVTSVTRKCALEGQGDEMSE